ncbi:unnamed protein product, partial [Allacma fusca]
DVQQNSATVVFSGLDTVHQSRDVILLQSVW